MATPQFAEADLKAQAEFDTVYISSNEICLRLDINRSSLAYQRRLGRMPGAVQVPGSNMFVWKREAIEPFVQAYEAKLKMTRGEFNG